LLHARAQHSLLGMREDVLHDVELDAEKASALLEPDTLRRRLRALASPNTTHFSIATADGGLAAVTMSNGYGSGITVPGTGVICNNSLGEPELNPGGYHAASPGTRMVSNMAPTLALHPDGRFLAMGSPGASRITTAIAQAWVHYALEEQSFEDAVTSPRLHLEPMHDGLRAQCEPGIDHSLLQQSDYIVRPFEGRDMYFGAVKLVGRDREGRLHAIADDRRGGATRLV
jgi:gamma-glutamyltranspeptidase/glutathione hydrolase